MDLHCWPHNRTHHFTPGEVEQIVYALTGMLSTEETAEPLGLQEPRLICPKEALALARDSECYLEHVEQGVECRKALA